MCPAVPPARGGFAERGQRVRALVRPARGRHPDERQASQLQRAEGVRGVPAPEPAWYHRVRQE